MMTHSRRVPSPWSARNSTSREQVSGSNGSKNTVSGARFHFLRFRPPREKDWTSAYATWASKWNCFGKPPVRDELLRQAKRVVIKIGSSLVASRETGLSAERIERLAGEIAEVRAQGREVLVVSSGAVVSGIKKLGLREYPKSLPLKQAAAAVGQSLLMWGLREGL
jgi:hypothetical protein